MVSHPPPPAVARRRLEKTLTLDDGTVCPPAYDIGGDQATATLDCLISAITMEIDRLNEPTPWDKLPNLTWKSMTPLLRAVLDPSAVVALTSWTLLTGVSLACVYGVLTRSQGTRIRTLGDRRRSYVERLAELYREE